MYGPISSRKTREGTLEIDRNNNILSPKYLAERYLLYTAREVNLPITILRPHAVLGQFDPCQAGQIFYRLSKNLPILGLGETSPVTNPVYVYDLVDIICRSIEDNRSIGKIFNVAGDKSVTLDEFVSICSDVSGINGQLSRVSAIADYTKYGTRFNRHGGPVIDWPIGDFVCDNSAVKDTLGIRFTPLTQVLCEIWSSFASSPRTLNTFSFIGESPILKQETISRFTQFRWRALRIGNTIRWSVKKMIKRQPALNRVIRHVRPVLNRSLNRFPKK